MSYIYRTRCDVQEEKHVWRRTDSIHCHSRFAFYSTFAGHRSVDFCLTTFVTALSKMSEASTTNLSKQSRWTFAQVEASKIQDVAAQKALKWYDIEQGDMPTSVHVQLMKQGEIPDPYKGMNEYDVQVSDQE